MTNARSNIPEGWTTATTKDIIDIKYGKGLIEENRNASGSINVYGSNGIVGKHDKAITQGQTIIIGRKGSVGEINLSCEGCWPIDTTYYIDSFPCDLPPEYWTLYLKSLRLGQRDKSSAIPGLNRNDLYSIEVALPPLNEQRRIVEKLEKLLERVESAKARLEKLPVILKRFRQSVLSAACSGKLTADWRKENLHEKSVTENSDFPVTWERASLKDVCETIVDCPHSTPKWTDSGEICLRTTNFRPGFLNLSEIRFVSPKTYIERISRLEPRHGDVLYSREGGILGIACILPPNTKACLGQRMMLMRANQKIYTPKLLEHVLNSPITLDCVRGLTGGSASPHLNVKDIKAFSVPLPPLPEQREIVRRVEALFAIADKIEARTKKAKAFVDSLTPSLLAKAFRGDLVPQDPSDEPASVLLERIRNERAKQETKSKVKKRRK